MCDVLLGNKKNITHFFLVKMRKNIPEMEQT